MIPTLFAPNPNHAGAGPRICERVNSQCEWVMRGEGQCYKLDSDPLTLAHDPFTQDGRPPRHWFGIRSWLAREISTRGLFWIHPDGRRAQVTREDFGYCWPPLMKGRIEKNL